MGIAIKATEDRGLRCALTPAERHQKAERVAEVLQQIDEAEAELETAKARAKGRLRELEGERDANLAAFRTGYEIRDVHCELQLDLEAGRAQWVRTDTGEVMSERGLRPEERQVPLFGDEQQSATDRGAQAEVEPGDEEAPAPPRGKRGRRGADAAGGETNGAAAL